MKLNDGTEYKGYFENNVFMKGTIRYSNGDEYNGTIKNGLRNSSGSYVSAVSKTIYEGGWINDSKNGKGTVWLI